MQKECTVKDVPTEFHLMKRAVCAIFKSLAAQETVTLKTTKKNALFDLLSVVPEMVTDTAKRSNIIKGFQSPGMIDSQFQRYPDFKSLLSMYRKNPSKEEHDLYYKTFPQVLKQFMKEGHVANTLFNQLRFAPDLDTQGVPIHPLARISQEYLQRCKCLTHFTQKEARRQRLEEIVTAIDSKKQQKTTVFAVRDVPR